jgi:hypothetical protein
MSDKKLSRSRRLRRYEIEYKKFIKNMKETDVKNNIIKSPRRYKNRESNSSNISKDKSKRKLNSYQKFVKKEMNKEKYKDMPSKERMIKIGELWKNKNK